MTNFLPPTRHEYVRSRSNFQRPTQLICTFSSLDSGPGQTGLRSRRRLCFPRFTPSHSIKSIERGRAIILPWLWLMAVSFVQQHSRLSAVCRGSFYGTLATNPSCVVGGMHLGMYFMLIFSSDFYCRVVETDRLQSRSG